MACSLFACTPKENTPTNEGQGLLNFMVKIPEQPGEYGAVKKGPYAPDEEIIIQLPSSYDDPVDITALEAYASFDNDCYADPAVPSIIDFTEPYVITVVFADGSKQTNTIKIEYVYPNEWRSWIGIKTGAGVHRESLKPKDIAWVQENFGLTLNDDEADAIGIVCGYKKKIIGKIPKEVKPKGAW